MYLNQLKCAPIEMCTKKNCNFDVVMLNDNPALVTNNSNYRLGMVNSKSFVSKVLLQIKWKFELNSNLEFEFSLKNSN